MQPNQQVTFFSDGGATVRELPLYLCPEAEHLLDWFHVTMRLTVLAQCAKGLPRLETTPRPVAAAVLEADEMLEAASNPVVVAAQVERIKHYLWHGNVHRALQQVDGLALDLEAWQEHAAATGDALANLVRMSKYLRELRSYLENNRTFIPNYGERYRNGETIATAFVESTVNQVISKRMVKKQQMQWTPPGAHLLLQARTAVLNNELELTFREWYPGFRPIEPEGMSLAA
jgi:hypothetical protein